MGTEAAQKGGCNRKTTLCLCSADVTIFFADLIKASEDISICRNPNLYRQEIYMLIRFYISLEFYLYLNTENTLHLKCLHEFLLFFYITWFFSHVSSWNIVPTSTINILIYFSPHFLMLLFQLAEEIFFPTSALRHGVTAKANRFQDHRTAVTFKHLFLS